MFINFLIFFLVLISVFAMFTVFATMRERRAAERWTRTFGDIEDLPKQYPFRNDNDAAVKLEILSNRLGIDFTLYGERPRRRPFYSDRKRLEEAQKSVWKAKHNQLNLTNEEIDPPSDTFAKYVLDYQKKIEEVKDHLLTSPPILWRQNLNGNSNYGPDPELPNTSAITQLQQILSVRSLELAAAKNYVEAEEYLEAGWRLNDSLRSRPELDLQLDAMQSDQHLMFLMRKLPVDQKWIPRIMAHNYEKAIIKGFQIEAWFLWRMRNEKQLTRNSMLNETVDPYVHLSVASLIETERKDIERIQRITPCSLGRKDFSEWRPEQPGWNRIHHGRSLLWDKNSIYGSITDVRIDRELTARVIQVRHGYFPKDGVDKSETCKDGIWNFSQQPDGTTSIQYAGRLELPTRGVPNLPTFVVARTRVSE